MEQREFGAEKLLCDVVMVGTCHSIFVKSCKMYNMGE